MKNAYLKHSLESAERILSLIDRNPFSKTYGCIDRNFWHYKKIDFPAGTSQIGTLFLALLHETDFKGNVYYKNKNIRELSIAAIRFLAKSAHGDGTSDDYYPFERALGATSFSLYGASEAYILLKIHDEAIDSFFRKVADWILKHNEPGKISNHQFVAAVALVNVHKITGEQKYLDEAKRRIKQGISWMSPEGWFYEYEGCDPGYLTFSIDFLAKYYKKTKDKSIIPKIKKAVEVASYFIHPDGSYGGVYGSRNTMHFLPHGFEILSDEIPLAGQIADLFIEGLNAGVEERMNDDNYFMFDYDCIQAYADYADKRHPLMRRNDFRRYLKEARILIVKQKEYYAIISFAKGGVCRIFKGKENICNDAGLIAETTVGDVIASQIIDSSYKVRTGFEKNSNQASKNTSQNKVFTASIEGKFNKTDTMLQSPGKFLIFRLFMTSFGRINYFSHLVKKVLTKSLILKKSGVATVFKRVFDFSASGRITITDTIKIGQGTSLKRLAIGPDHTTIYIPSSRYYQRTSTLSPWIFYDKEVVALNNKRTIIIVREI
jgi:hypothetical protein